MLCRPQSKWRSFRRLTSWLSSVILKSNALFLRGVICILPLRRMVFSAMTPTAQPAAILFDLDGTLMDDNRAVESAIKSFHSAYHETLHLSIQDLTRRWKELLNLHFERYLKGEISMLEQRRQRIRDLFAYSGHSVTIAVADEMFGFYEHSYRGAWIAFPDVAEAFPALSRYRLAVLTNGDLSQQTQKLQAVALINFFCGVFTSSEIGYAKPRVEAFLCACERLQLDPESCVYVGDDLDVDARGSAAAGLISVWLDRSGSGAAPGGKIEVIHTLAELQGSIRAPRIAQE